MAVSVGDIFADGYHKFKNYLRAAYAGLSEYDAEDIVQQTALNMISRSGETHNVEYMTSYIYAALRNGAKNMFRRRGKEVPGDGIKHAPTDSAEDELIQAEMGEMIAAALDLLDEKSRYVFVETEINGTSYKEMAARTGEPMGTLLSRKNRAVKKLKAILFDYMEE